MSTEDYLDDLHTAITDALQWRYRREHNTIKTTMDWHMYHSSMRRLAELQARMAEAA